MKASYTNVNVTANYYWNSYMNGGGGGLQQIHNLKKKKEIDKRCSFKLVLENQLPV